MPDFTCHRLRDDLPWGVRIEGVDRKAMADAEVRAELNRIFAKEGLIVFSGMEPSAQVHVMLSEVFGELKEHPTKSTYRSEEVGDTAPGVIDLISRPQDAANDVGKVVIEGKAMVGFSPWHFDHCYNDELNWAGVLRNLIPTPEGGRTGFCDGIELYKSLPADLRERIEGLNVLYHLDVRMSRMRFGRPRGMQVLGDTAQAIDILDEAATFPRAVHPAVWTRKTGEKVLHVGSWMSVGLEHHEDTGGDMLLEAVCQWINENCNAYWHHWKPGGTDMLIWDNWRMLHAVEGFDPSHERKAQRTTIRGDYGLGYFEHGKRPGEVQIDLTPELVALAGAQ